MSILNYTSESLNTTNTSLKIAFLSTKLDWLGCATVNCQY